MNALPSLERRDAAVRVADALQHRPHHGVHVRVRRRGEHFRLEQTTQSLSSSAQRSETNRLRAVVFTMAFFAASASGPS